ncbi:MAG TPA: hypothetical protein VEK57_18870 [Thermoanaerobaculia bacterium]|nr:hypothetical protein [Thermoanaerobaculia bacterium]
MATYKLSPAFLQAHRRRTLLSVPLLLLIVFGGTAAMSRQVGSQALIIVLPIIGIALVYAMWRAFQRQVVLARSFELDVQPDRLTRTLQDFPALTLHRADVVRIEHHRGGEITLHARERAQSLRIPAGVDRRDELLGELAGWGTIESAGPVQSQGWGVAASVLVVAAFAVTVNATSRAVVAITGSLLFATFVTCSILLFRSGNPKLRRIAFIALLPALAVLVRVISVL